MVFKALSAASSLETALIFPIRIRWRFLQADRGGRSWARYPSPTGWAKPMPMEKCYHCSLSLSYLHVKAGRRGGAILVEVWNKHRPEWYLSFALITVIPGIIHWISKETMTRFWGQMLFFLNVNCYSVFRDLMRGFLQKEKTMLTLDTCLPFVPSMFKD